MSADTALLSSVSVAPPAPAMTRDATIAGAKQAGENFEAFFLSQAFENMFSGVETDPMFGGGNGESIYRSLMIQEYAKAAAKSGVTGIGAAVTREILHLQGIDGGK
jgi:flagellar protein FlgJ